MTAINLNIIKKKISICALAYNHFNYLDDFFTGVLNQQLDDYTTEIIIGVDQCEDQTLAKCLDYQRRYPSLIKLIIHSERVGMMQNFVSVLGNADGEYIAFCECDDYWIDENKLCKQLKLLGQHPDASFCFTDIRILKSETGDFEKNWATILKDKYNLEDIINNNVMSNCTVLMKNNLDTVMLNRVINFQVGDWPLYILSMYKSNTNAIYLNKVTTIYRHHMGGFHSTKNTIQRLQITNDVYKRLLRIVESRRILRCLNRQLAKNFYSMGVFQTNRTLAVENYRLSIKQISPSNLKFPLLSTVRVFQTFFFTNRIFNGKRNSFGECFNDSI